MEREKNRGSEELNREVCAPLGAWWANRDSNPGPSGYEPDALTN